MGVVVKSQYGWFLAALLSLLAGLLWMRSMGHPSQQVPGEGLLFPLGGVLLDDRPVVIELAATPSEPLLLLTVRLRYPDRLKFSDRLSLQIFESDRPLLSKYLHRGDTDLFLILKPNAGSPRLLTVGRPGERTVPFEVALAGTSQEASSQVVVEAEPNNCPEEATPFTLGATVFASADDRPFVPAPGQDEEEARAAGVDWYAFRLEGSQQRLVFISLDVLDREVPLDVTLFQSQNGRPVPYTEDLEPVEPQPSGRFTGQKKFLAGRLVPGDYYLRVHASHPAYELRTQTYPVPPHHPELMGGLEPAVQQALRAAMDYLILKGDSWYATPRARELWIIDSATCTQKRPNARLATPRTSRIAASCWGPPTATRSASGPLWSSSPSVFTAAPVLSMGILRQPGRARWGRRPVPSAASRSF